jgi:polar amino acid transport system substrate-binding protein
MNACDSLSGPERAIGIRTGYAADTDEVVCEVWDEGVGIPENVMKRIFDPFFTTKRDVGGTGLGLPVSNGIMQSHGGTLNFMSEPGKGTRAIMRLPAHAREKQ